MTPDLSVVIPAVNGVEILIECLEALRVTQANPPALEIIVVNRCGEDVRTAVARRAPEVTLVPVPIDTAIPTMRAIGIERARGSAIAMIEDHILVPPDWAIRMQQILRSGAEVVGGSVKNAATTTTVDWAAFFCEYSHVLAPRAGNNVERLTGNNVTYRRELGERYSSMLRAGHWEDDFHDALRRDGVSLVCAPEIAVGHKMHYRMNDYVSQRFLYSRAFAGGASRKLTRLRRAAGLLKAAVLPPVLFARIVRRVHGSGRHRNELLKSLPLLAVFVCAWAAGEAVGYVLGPGDALARVR